MTTAHIEDLAGRHLSAGDSFAEIVDSSLAKIDVAIDDQDVLLLRTDSPAMVKLDSLPVRTFRGHVAVVSPKGTLDGGKRYFFARITLPNPDGLLRPGMRRAQQDFCGLASGGLRFVPQAGFVGLFQAVVLDKLVRRGAARRKEI